MTGAGPAPLRVVTINTGKGDGPYRARLALLAEQLAAHEPDVVACQEALAAADGSLSTARFLADALRMDLRFARLRRKPRVVEGATVDTWSGLAVLSRWPFLGGARTLHLPSHADDGERAALLCVLIADGRVVRLANTHLTHLRGADALRREELAHLLREPWLHCSADVRLLCGDLNAVAGSPALDWLMEGEHGWSVADAYAAGGGVPGRGTLPGRSGVTVDYVLGLARPGEVMPRFTDARVVLTADVDGVRPSDHFGVAVSVG